MTRHGGTLVPWTPTDVVVIPAEVRDVNGIIRFGSATLSKRDMHSIVSAFDAGSYEMVATFVWTKATAALKRQVATLGMEFVGEMLGRPDLNDDSDPASSIADHEAVALAEDLGMVTTTQALRLKQALQLVAHFSAGTGDIEGDDEMMPEEALALTRTCITSILGKPKFDAALEFASFRNRLATSTLSASDPDLVVIGSAPYFFVRTTVSILLAAVKTLQGAPLEHSVGNVMVLVPELWGKLREPEKWQVGQAYAEVTSAGNRISSAGLKRALMQVKGFDFVPESLRSSTFTEAAARVLSAHFAINNFYNELEPMQALASLGTSIPWPAFAKVVEAALAVRLGNRWGVAYNAQDAANAVLTLLRPTQWQYYLDECLPRDRTVLDKLASDPEPAKRWCELASTLALGTFEPRNPRVKALFDASRRTLSLRTIPRIQAIAHALRSRLET
jgi:hypothetical protein